ncbi:MAG: hypothetical protein IIY44_05415 [Erysipelotrichales bacterium]|nr:hypothetical protein [Erysipelotrichales bacterium]MBQ4375624.1 hypothetical protein [Erysipelotrichales bacterium]MBQ5541583.1 hypothetical protein [Erysipelotrichales bacterium]
MLGNKWTCEKCGYRNNGVNFCAQCGNPKEDRIAGRPYPQKPRKYKTWNDAVKENIVFGELLTFESGGSYSGMMINDYQRYSTVLARDEDGVRITDQTVKSRRYEKTAVYRADDAAFSDLEELIRKENLPAWSFVEKAEGPMLLDVSRTSYYSMTFSALAGGIMQMFSVDPAVFSEQDRKDIPEKIRRILDRYMIPERLIKEEVRDWINPDTQNPLMEPKEGEWACPHCGYNRNTGKYCSECGTEKP